MSYPILLTGTIDVTNTIGGANSSLAVKDVSTRCEQYSRAIERYIRESVFDVIVFAENSNYSFNAEYFKELARKFNKKFEYITFVGDAKKVKKFGKSYGDAEIIDYGLNKSELLKNEETIYKITGRIFLRNSKKICKTMKKNRNEFLRFRGQERCITYFFKFNKSDYKKYLSGVGNECDEWNGVDLETAFFNRICNTDIKIGAFRNYPKFTGVIGGLGIPYDKPWYYYIIGDIALKLGFFKVK